MCVCNLVLWWGTKTNKRNRDSCCAFTLAFKHWQRRFRAWQQFYIVPRPLIISGLIRRGGGGGGNLKSSKVKSCAFLLVFHHILRGGLFLFWGAMGMGGNGHLTLKREPLTKSTCRHWSVKGWNYIGIFSSRWKSTHENFWTSIS